ncbi:MAG: MCP four helix bundle domain-containing protein, partial [Oscillospiraceae bacterium]|nr:MCP four helix bundle domain-containing protein [Oscillospiraceae bacterium]
MKNIKVSVLLISSFLLIALLTAVVGIVSLVGIRTVDDSNDDMYENLTVPMPHLAKAIELLQRQRACMREFIIGSAVGDQSLIEDAYDRVRSYRPVMEVSMDEYFKTIHAPEAIRLFEEARRIYEGDFTDCIEKIHAAAKRGDDPVAMYELMRGYTDQINKVVDNFDVCMAMKIEVAAETAQASSDTADGIFLMVVVIMLLSILIAVVLAIYISGIISKPI